MDGVVLSGPKAHLLGHVRSLRHSRDGDIETKYQMRRLAQDSGKYLSSLHNIYDLTLHNTRVEHISEDAFCACFSAFRGALTSLFLDTCVTSFSAFVTLVDYFPNITTLKLSLFALEPDEGPIPPLSRPLRGKVHVRRAHANRLEFFNRFSKLHLEYEELIIDSPFVFVETEFLESALQISASTVKFLRVTAELGRK